MIGSEIRELLACLLVLRPRSVWQH